MIVLAPEGEAVAVAASKVAVGTIEATAGTWINKVLKQGPLHPCEHGRTRSLFRAAARGASGVLGDVVQVGIEACHGRTGGAFPPEPVKNHDYKVRAMESNDETGSPFFVIVVYR